MASYSYLCSACGHANAAFFEPLFVGADHRLCMSDVRLRLSCIMQGAFVIAGIPHCQ